MSNVRTGTGVLSDWSTKSQIQPPWRTSCRRITSQYFLKLPVEFPIECAYSIITYGRLSEASCARCSTRAGLSYILDRMSLTAGRSSPSYWITRVGS